MVKLLRCLENFKVRGRSSVAVPSQHTLAEHEPVLELPNTMSLSAEVVEKRLDGLPNEIATMILEFVAIPRRNYPDHPVKGCLGTKDLLSVMACSHHFQSVGESVLYRTFIQRSHKELPNFIRTLCSRPELAQYVRYVKLNEVHGTADLHSSLSPENLSIIRSQLRVQADSEAFQFRQWSALATWVLLRSPNVEKLKITWGWDNAAQQLGFLEDAFGAESYRSETDEKPPFLPKLRHVEFSVGNRKYSPSIGTPLRILQHRSLETFVADNIVDMGYAFASPLGQPLIMLKSLRFERSNISMTALSGILSCCPVLEQLVYDREQSNLDQRPRQPFLPQQFLPIIKHLRPCLRELILYRPELTDMQRDMGAESAAEMTTIGSLVKFEELSNLTVTAHLLLGLQEYPDSYWAQRYNEVPQPDQEKKLKLSKCLPRSLEELKLKNCGEGVMKDVLELVKDSRVVLPRLRSIVLEFRDLAFNAYLGGFAAMAWRQQATHLWVNQRELDGLEDACQAKGIVLDVWYN